VQIYFDRPDPQPQEGEILIKLRAAGVARIDMALRSGYLQAFNGHLPFPQVMGIEGAGDVLAIGAGVTDFRVGDAVFGYESAAAIPVSGTSALDALDGLDLPDGATVLINGVGGSTGLVTAELARARGLTVIGTGSDSKRPVAEALGITFVSYQTGDVTEQVRTLAPAGVDGMIDLVGGDSMRSVAGLVKDARRLVSVADDAVTELGGTFVVRRLDRAGLEKVAALMVAGKTDAHISRSVPFDQAADAVAAVESGHTTGKVIITFAA
jgi:NADPH:quinone reductase